MIVRNVSFTLALCPNFVWTRIYIACAGGLVNNNSRRRRVWQKEGKQRSVGIMNVVLC